MGNCQVTGGLFRMAPAADPQDGKLTFVYAYAPSRLKMLSLLPRAISGSYVNDSAVHLDRRCRGKLDAQSCGVMLVNGGVVHIAAVDGPRQQAEHFQP